ncbi:hypothetical protein NHX12_020351 [Muraenolepis orangiensis]|uniref:Double minute 2 protein n=1 Tax=Muraenolepis orangiensis TaxID=630683 RepID=A0A9Q0ERA6_9TELE|nr:hypothetical protein NHX12_020351 [Muraenolepis orangiensis]
MKEVMHYLGQYIKQKQLYDQTQQHIIHCSHDALGQVLGVHSFSVKEPRVLFSLITKNLVAVTSNESSPEVSQQCDVQKEVYEVTIFEAEEDSSDEDTEITQADYWRCSKCKEWNPPLPRNCNRCWELRQDWLPELSVSKPDSTPSDPKVLPPKPAVDQIPTHQDTCPGAEEEMDVPDGRRSHPPPSSSKQPVSPPPPERGVWVEGGLPDSCVEPCVICQSRPKNGCIVHGRTGHLIACYSCAKKLKKRNKLCPVCREPIQSVVLTYLS